jgi:hypothetical protein
LVEQFQPRLNLRERLEYPARAIGRAIIDGDEFPIDQGLRNRKNRAAFCS